MKHRTLKNQTDGELACRSLSPKAWEVYSSTDPCTVFAYETEEGTRYDVTEGKVTIREGMTFAELNEFFEDLHDVWIGVDAE